MPGHAGSPYWAAVDFDSEGEEDQTPPSNHRVYLDPWDNEAVGMIQGDTPDSSQEDNMNSFAGEPVSASFYYVPTKNYDSGEEIAPPHKRSITHEAISPEYATYNRKLSRTNRPDYSDMALYGHAPIHERRRSMYIEDPIYGPRPMAYEPIYAPIPIPQPGYLPPPPRSRMSLPHHPEYMMANLGYGKQRRHSRLTEAYEPFAYECVSPEYEDWARPMPKTAPNNFHLSRYGHLQIDYSCSWNSLDRLIRHQ
ncbi:uncharacterized protein [Epargyreus clarus]|uniref:uncharacterized protein n=1 Tax=Epargyreus clarus TaxID=520877 RepID=UPI003C2E1F2F